MTTEQIGAVASLIVCGDLHLRGRRGAAASELEAFVSFLEQLAREAELVVINGDLFDLDRGRFPCAQRWEFERTRAQWETLESAIERLGVRVIAGNHDDGMRGISIGGAPVRAALALTVGGKSVRIEHGQRFDAWVKRVRWVTSFVTWLSGLVEEGPLRPVYRLMRCIERVTTRDERGGVERRALRWLVAQDDYDLLILGHTHRRSEYEAEGRQLLNPGDLMSGRYRFLRLDEKDARPCFGEGDGRGPLRYECKARLDESP